jgi:hypothetical protein
LQVYLLVRVKNTECVVTLLVVEEIAIVLLGIKFIEAWLNPMI